MTADWPLPSYGELEILRVLWRRGPSTVREVHAELARDRDVVYNTVGKLLQIMEGKGLVSCDAGSRAHVYAARVPQDRAQGRLVADLAARAFGGSAAKLVVRALEQDRLSAEERAEIRRMLESLDSPELPDAGAGTEPAG